MDRALNREIIRLSVPSILANLTVPLVGLVDTAIAGHIDCSAAACIGGISVGAVLFNLIYWNFSFLRSGTGGLTAQAFGRGDIHECARIFARGLGLALVLAALTLAVQKPFSSLAIMAVKAGPEVCALALQYFFIRVWAAPATVSLMVFRGWFVGMQDSVSSMWTDMVINVVNIASSLVLAFGIGQWHGMGFAGIAMGTVIAQYSGLLYVVLVCCFKYGKRVFGGLGLKEIISLYRWKEVRPFMRMNADLLVRSLGMTGIYIGYTLIAANFGDVLLAVSSIMMQLLMIFSYFTDGFAYAGEALTGRFIGARDSLMQRKTVRYIFAWSMSIAVLFVGIYALTGEFMFTLMTSDSEVLDAGKSFIPWLVMMPLLGCPPFTWDGIYLGATASKHLALSMVGSTILFFTVWFALKAVLMPGFPYGPTGSAQPELCLHLLLTAYFSHLFYRLVHMSAFYRSSVRI